MKTCHKCKKQKPLKMFGRNAANFHQGAKDGRNINCHECVRTRMTEYRAELKLNRRPQQNPLPLIGLVPERLQERVFQAIQNGARTQGQIVHAISRNRLKTGSPYFQHVLERVGDSLAVLLDNGRIQIRNGMYFTVNKLPELEMGYASFSSLGGILFPVMKGRAA